MSFERLLNELDFRFWNNSGLQLNLNINFQEIISCNSSHY